ncbi:hypothetical protein ACFL9T_23300 [Thermodesulfobacteriota bacterium]
MIPGLTPKAVLEFLKQTGKGSGERQEMGETLQAQGDTMKAIKDFLKVNGIHNFLLVGQDDMDQVIAIGQGHREILETLLMALMLKDDLMLEIFSEALRAARAEQAKDN